MAAETTEEVAGAGAVGEASQGAQAQTAAQLLQALAQSQSDMKLAFDAVTRSLTENLSKVQSLSEDFAKKQDTNVDEALAGASGVLGSNQVTVSNLINTHAALLAQVAASRGQTHFDNLQAIVSLNIAGAAFNQNLAQGFVAFNGHHQCGITANAK